MSTASAMIDRVPEIAWVQVWTTAFLPSRDPSVRVVVYSPVE